jgi:hypothetical protein
MVGWAEVGIAHGVARDVGAPTGLGVLVAAAAPKTELTAKGTVNASKNLRLFMVALLLSIYSPFSSGAA